MKERGQAKLTFSTGIESLKAFDCKSKACQSYGPMILCSYRLGHAALSMFLNLLGYLKLSAMNLHIYST